VTEYEEMVKRAVGEALKPYLEALVDDAVKGLMRSIGDAEAAPANVAGKTLLKYLSDIPRIDRQCKHDSGSVTVSPASMVTTASIVGAGNYMLLPFHYSSGVGATDAYSYPIIDGITSYRFLDHRTDFEINSAAVAGLTSVGWHINRVFVAEWDTVNHVYRITNRLVEPSPFRSSLELVLRNGHLTSAAAMRHIVLYSLMASSRRFLLKLKEFKHARVVAEKLKRAALPFEGITVERLGYFTNEEEHPYRDFLADLPNRWDEEIGPAKAKSASVKVQNFIVSLETPEQVETRDVEAVIRPAKVLYEEG